MVKSFKQLSWHFLSQSITVIVTEWNNDHLCSFIVASLDSSNTNSICSMFFALLGLEKVCNRICVFSFCLLFSATTQGTFSSQITLILVHVVHYLPPVWQLNLTLAENTQLSDCGCCQVERLSSEGRAVTVIYFVLSRVLMLVWILCSDDL